MKIHIDIAVCTKIARFRRHYNHRNSDFFRTCCRMHRSCSSECRKHKISRISSFSYRYLFYSIRHILVYYFKDPFRSFQHSKPDLFSQLLYTCFCRFDIKPHISGKEFLFIQISQHQICITYRWFGPAKPVAYGARICTRTFGTDFQNSA